MLEIRFSHVEEVLFATASGVLDTRSDQNADQTIASECNRRGCKKPLIEFCAVSGTLKRIDCYQGGTSLEARGFCRAVFIAFLDRREFVDANRFYETVATNRGFQMRHFYEFEDALAWLNGPEG